MRRFYIEKINEKNGLCAITGSEARHILKVLRMEKGETLILIDGTGRSFLASLEKATRHEAQVRLLKPIPASAPSPVEITLCQSILKSKQMDYMIQKTTELGVDRIIPFYSRRTVVQIGEAKIDDRLNHWQEVARNALKQSGRPTIPEIYHPLPFSSLVMGFRNDLSLKIILYEGEKKYDMKGLLKGISSGQNKIIGVIGPEGGFTGEEIECAVKAGFISTSVGNRILRAETAAITIAAIVQYELGDLSLR